MSEVARITGLTVRALHHYDAIDLVRPGDRSDAGYRLYGADDLERLFQVVVYRELGFPLEQIKQLVDDPEVDRVAALRAQRRELDQRIERSRRMIAAIDRALAALDGDETMKPEEMFEGFDPAAHEAEAGERWGDSEAYRESSRRTAKYDEKDWKALKAEGSAIVAALADLLAAGTPAGAAGAMDLAEDYRLHVERWFYPCNHAMHVGLAEMYVADERFRGYYDRVRPGLAEYVAKAIRADAARH